MEKLRAEISSLEKLKHIPSETRIMETQTEPIKPKSSHEASTQAYETAGIKIAHENVD